MVVLLKEATGFCVLVHCYVPTSLSKSFFTYIFLGANLG
jgi:hypothetical protein